MKPKNFPAKKLMRQLKASTKDIKDHIIDLEEARKTRTKKFRGTSK